MPTVTEEFVYIILYPRYRDGTKEEARFDMDYYMNTHVKESQVLWKKMGLKKIEVHKVGRVLPSFAMDDDVVVCIY